MSAISGASGIIYKNNKIFIISDDSDVLYIYDELTSEFLRKSFREDGEIRENIPKSKKMDLESIAFSDGKFYLFGSGSTLERCGLIVISERDFSFKHYSVSELYKELQKISGIDNENFNIEGAILINGNLLLFNRGNGPKKQNGIFVIEDWKRDKHTNSRYFPILLPTLHNSSLGFTDATFYEGKIYFLAAAEAVESTYVDGEIIGSVIGVMNSETFEVEWIQQISNKHKFEGISLYLHQKNGLVFILCEDPDDGSKDTSIYRLTLNENFVP